VKFLSLVLAFLLASCSLIRQDVPSLNSKPLGVSVLYEELRSDPSYKNTVLENFSSITPENAMKFEVIHPSQDVSIFKEADFIVKWAGINNISLRGHPVIWHRQIPVWIKDAKLDYSSVQEIFDAHTLELVSRYRNTIQIWDVVNEAMNSDGSLRESIWLKNIGPDYIKKAFILAHYANPKAKLFYNDYDISKPGPKSEAVYNLLKSLLAIKIPIHGIGFQMHLRPDFMPTEEEIKATFKKFADLGLEIHITELDIAIPTPSTKVDRAQQKQTFEMVTRSCKAIDACKLISLWGLHDGVSWIPSHFSGLGEATLFDGDIQEKEAYQGFCSGLR